MRRRLDVDLGTVGSIVDDLKLARQAGGLLHAPESAFAGCVNRPSIRRFPHSEQVDRARTALIAATENYCGSVEQSGPGSGPWAALQMMRALLLCDAPRMKSLSAHRSELGLSESFVRYWESRAIEMIAQAAFEATRRSKGRRAAEPEVEALEAFASLAQALNILKGSIEPAIRTSLPGPHPQGLPVSTAFYLMALGHAASEATRLTVMSLLRADIPAGPLELAWSDAIRFDPRTLTELRAAFELSLAGYPRFGIEQEVHLDTITREMIGVLRSTQIARLSTTLDDWADRVSQMHRGQACDFHEPPAVHLCELHHQYNGCERFLDVYARLRRGELSVSEVRSFSS